jgi:uncharacterized protein (DUF433 family)
MTEYIVRDGETGRALVASTGTPVDEILQAIQDGAQFEAVLARHPELTPEAIAAALRFARNAVGREFRYVPDPTFAQYELREEPLHAYNAGHGSAEPGTVDDALQSATEQRRRLRYELDVIDSIHAGLEDVAAGRLIPHEEVMARLRARFPE